MTSGIPVAARHSVWCILMLSPVIRCATPNLSLQVSSETAPPGGFAQFKVSLTAPALVSAAGISMNFDPAIFGPVASIAAFSATGDQTGFANLNGTQVTATFNSASSSIGQLPALPVLVVTVPILATAKIGATSSVTADPTQGPWTTNGATAAVTANPGTFLVGGALSVQNVTPGGGLLPSGTVVTIDGTGFDATTTVTIDGVSIASTQLISPQQLNIRLGGATEMSGKHIHIAGAAIDYFPALQGTIAGPASSRVLLLPSLPSPQYSAVTWDYPSDSGFVVYYSCLQNPSASPVTATYYFATTDLSNTPVTTQTIVIPPYGLYVANNSSFATSGLGVIYMTASAPLRMAEYFGADGDAAGSPATASVFLPTQMTSLGFLGLQAEGTGDPAVWNWQVGTPSPQPATVRVLGPFPFAVSLSGGAQEWLTVTPSQGTPPATLTLTPNVAQLGQGTYRGTVTLTPILPAPLAQFGPGTLSFQVTINVYATPPPSIAVSGMASFFATTGAAPAPATVNVTSNGAPASFTSSVAPGSWLLVSPSSGTTPATLTLTANPVGLGIGTYQTNLTIQGPGNAALLTAQLVVSSATPGALTVSPSALAFSLVPGTATLNQVIGIQPTISAATISVTTQSGGNWLAAVEDDQFVSVSLTAAASNLASGTYQGTVTIASPALNLSAAVPVTLIAGPLTGASQMSVSPSSLTLTGATRATAMGTLNVNLISGSPFFTMQVSADPALQIQVLPPNPPPAFTTPSAYIAPATFQILVSARQPGTYRASITVSWSGGSATIPVIYNGTAAPDIPPTMSAIVSAGSQIPGAIAPAELITIFGTGLLGTEVFINGIAAPIIYNSAGQVNTSFPSEIGVTGTASVQVIAAGIKAGAWDVPIAPYAPSIFTISGTGVGQGAIVNQDGTVNSASNPAPRGTVIQIYGTGGGSAVTIGGVNAQILYAGGAPDEIAGLMQINAVIPPAVTPGLALPVIVTIGGISSQPAVTVAVQ